MTDGCEPHRSFTSAVADRETGLVPAASLQHILGCAECSDEVLAHQIINRRLAAGVLTAERPVRGRAGRSAFAVVRLAAVAALVAGLIGGAGLAWWRSAHGVDRVAEAASVARAGPAMRSADAAEIATWCASESSRRSPVVALSGFTPTGARMDTAGGVTVVTIFYSAAPQGQLAVGWLDDRRSEPEGERAETRTLDGRTVMVVHSPSGTAVVGGDAPPSVMWRAVGALEGADG